jgi:DNA-binding beta-propeller fold protein YncE
MKTKFLGSLVVAAVLLLASSSATSVAADSTAATYHQIALITLPPGSKPLTSFDISFVERSSQTYYLADRSNKGVDVFDASSNTFETRVSGFVGFTGNNDTSGPNGIVVVHDRGELWAGDGNSTVKVIDLRTNSIVETISTGGTARADEIAYDQKDKLILVANDADTPPFATLIDVQSRAVVATIAFGDATAGLEQPVWDRETHLFYLSVPETASHPGGAVAVIDPRTRSRVALFPVQNCGPTGLALGPKQQLLLGCGDKTALQVMDARSGDIVATIPQVSGADEVWYNPGDKHYYVAARNNPSGPVLGVIDALTLTWIQNVPTGPNAHSVAANPINDEIFVPLRGKGIGVYHR